MEHLVKAVQRGIRYLDKHIPCWANCINLAELDLNFGNRCVLGQICEQRYPEVMGHLSHYSHILNYLNKHVAALDEIECGFASYTRADLRILTSIWKEEIAKRQTKVKPLVVISKEEVGLFDNSKYEPLLEHTLV